MKNYIFILLFVLNGYYSFSQPGEWTWMSGNNALNKKGVYGQPGVFNWNNKPGARDLGGSFTDLNNKFWLYGGHGYGYSQDTFGLLGDLWKYDPLTNKWAFIKGDTAVNRPAVYGTKGVPSPLNTPGGRIGFSTWPEVAGCLWLFSDDYYRNDLWRYNISTNEWTWMTGDSLSGTNPVYGTKNVAAASNDPGGRDRCCTWVGDDLNTLWLFGGGHNQGLHNNLWKYDIALNQWTWVNGDTIITSGFYGVKGVPSPANVPSSRYAWCSWKDHSGDFWLFGGSYGYDLNDLWRYSVTENEWTWMSGDSIPGLFIYGGNYGSKCVANPNNVPLRRSYNTARWTDACGNLIMYGGHQQGSDLWKYDINNNNWTWISGDSCSVLSVWSNPIYGTKGVSSPLNRCGTRNSAQSWLGADGSLWVFGGGFTSNSRRNDLWRYVPDPSCGGCVPGAINEFGNDLSHLVIYPNPSNGTFSLSIDKGLSDFNNYFVSDMTGQILFRGSFGNSKTQIDMNGYSPGVYMITVLNALESKTQKLVIF